MNKQLTIAAIAGALILPLSFVAKADGISGDTEFTVYGRVVAGADREDSDKDGESATWDLGATGHNGSRKQQSRLGFKADRDIGNGMNVGFKLEQGFAGGGGLSESRHRYVYISGGFGKLTIGNDGTMYDSTGYDGAYFLGGAFRGSGRREGIHYTNSIGPFSFGVAVTGDNGDASAVATNAGLIPATPEETDAQYLARVLAAARADGQEGTIPVRTMGQTDEAYADAIRAVYTTIPDQMAATLEETPDARRMRLTTATGLERRVGETNAQFDARLQAAAENTEASRNARIADEDIDRTIIGGSYDFGAFKLIAAYDGDNTDTDRDYTAISVKGDVGALSYQVGYETQDDATKGGENDHSVAGLFLAYSASENDTVYMEYETRDDDDMVAGGNEDASNTLLGYSRSFGGGAIFVAEYRSTDNDARNAADPSRLTLAMIVNF